MVSSSSQRARVSTIWLFASELFSILLTFLFFGGGWGLRVEFFLLYIYNCIFIYLSRIYWLHTTCPHGNTPLLSPHLSTFLSTYLPILFLSYHPSGRNSFFGFKLGEKRAKGHNTYTYITSIQYNTIRLEFRG
ncbi:hypothetical protein F5Y01DRAFT_166608 [Xylaria sp. FL0043]|nr:hypothetical protein F5Y01DRAFT_166608 [Xylaria sp. FL0043]